MAEISFNGASYTYPEAQAPNVNDVTDNSDGTETVTFRTVDPGLGYTYTVSITDSYGDVHVHEGNPSAPDFAGNDYYGVLTGYNNGGDFTVQNYTVGAPGNGSSDNFIWLFTSAVDNTGTLTLYADDRGGAFVPPVCYTEGTGILTTRGEVAVEALRQGDEVVTGSGERRAVRWLGSRAIDCRSHPDPRAVWPIRIAAHAFGDSRPARDLLVSPDHAIAITCIDEVLIPASRLLNGTTIARHPVDGVTYWHVELDSHDILLANGLPAESYLDVGNRSFFAQSDTVDLHAAPGDGQRSHADFCRPFVDAGPILDVVRGRLAARAAQLGWREDREADLHLSVDGSRVDGLRAADAVVFLVPGDATNVRLVSGTFVPDDFNGWGDRRGLGVAIRALSLLGADGEHRRIALDDPCLAGGCFDPETHDGRPRRWTDGDATLDPVLWDGMAKPVALRLAIDQTNVRGCQAPAPACDGVQDVPLRRVG